MDQPTGLTGIHRPRSAGSITQHLSFAVLYTQGCSSIQRTHCYLRSYGYSPAVFVGWFIVVDWNSGLIFALGHLITILSHQLRRTQMRSRWLTWSRIFTPFLFSSSTRKYLETKMINEMFPNRSAKYSHTLLPLYKHTGQECDSLRVLDLITQQGRHVAEVKLALKWDLKGHQHHSNRPTKVHNLRSHLKFMVLPVWKVQRLHLTDGRNVAVDPRAVQTDEDPQGAGPPTRIFREKIEKHKLDWEMHRWKEEFLVLGGGDWRVNMGTKQGTFCILLMFSKNVSNIHIIRSYQGSLSHNTADALSVNPLMEDKSDQIQISHSSTGFCFSF